MENQVVYLPRSKKEMTLDTVTGGLQGQVALLAWWSRDTGTPRFCSICAEQWVSTLAAHWNHVAVVEISGPKPQGDSSSVFEGGAYVCLQAAQVILGCGQGWQPRWVEGGRYNSFMAFLLHQALSHIRLGLAFFLSAKGQPNSIAHVLLFFCDQMVCCKYFSFAQTCKETAGST